MINPLNLRSCYSSGIIKSFSIFNELYLDDQDKTFYNKGNQSHANFAERRTIAICVSLIRKEICIQMSLQLLYYFVFKCPYNYYPPLGSRVGAVVRALASHQCDPGSTPKPCVICGLSLLLVLYSAPRGFSPGAPVFPSPQKPTFPIPIRS